MLLDIGTTWLFTSAICGVATLVLFQAWLSSRPRQRAYAWWTLAFLAGAIGTGLSAFRTTEMPELLTIQLANALNLTGLAMAWGGVMVFDGRRPSILGMVGGPVAFLALCRIPDFYNSVEMRVAAVSLLGALYTFAIAVAFHERRSESPRERALMTIAASAAGVALLARALLADKVAPGLDHGAVDGWVALVTLAPVPAIIGLLLLGLTLARSRSEAGLRRLALSDPLTGILNRRAFAERAERMIERVRRDGSTAALVEFDLDNFKSINDDYGHQAGDAVIQHFVGILTATCRPGDVIGRLGGEEFAIVLPGAGAQAARATAERMREALARQPVAAGGVRVPVTVSGGVAATDVHRGGFERLLLLADRALYAAKGAGRNRTEAAVPDAVQKLRAVPQVAMPPAA